jgi:hypothetical protein
MAIPSTPGSNITNYPNAPLYNTRAGGTVVPITVLMGATGVPSLVSCPIAISCASAAAGVLNFTGPSGLAIELMGQPVHWPVASSQSLTQWVPFNKSLVSGTFQLVHWKENAAGTAVSGVNPVSGDRVSFFLYVHSTPDGGAI